jgi:hypothetical protein
MEATVDPLDHFMDSCVLPHAAPQDPTVPSPPSSRAPKSANDAAAYRRRFITASRWMSEGAAFFSDAAMEERAPRLFHAILGHLLERSVAMPHSEEGEVDEEEEEENEEVGDEGAGARASARGSSANLSAAILALARGDGGLAHRERISLSSMLLSAAGSGERRRARFAEENADEDAEDEEEGPGDGDIHGPPVPRSAIVAAREELLRAMFSRFVKGADAAFFEYWPVDSDATLELGGGEGCASAWREAEDDAEQAYFDAEEEGELGGTE